MAATYTAIERAPSLEEYHRLCQAVGWESAIDFAVALVSPRSSGTA